MRQRLATLVAVIASFWLAAVDFLTSVNLGDYSLSGYATIATFVLLALVVPASLLAGSNSSIVVQRGMKHGVPGLLGLFLVYSCVRIVLEPRQSGFQYVLVFGSFFMAAVIFGRLGTPGQARAWHLRLQTIALVVTCAFLLTAPIGFPYITSRSFALSSILFMALVLPVRGRGALFRFLPVVIVFADALSLSRTGTVTALLMLPFIILRKREGSRNFGRFVLALLPVILLGWLLTLYGSFSDRFFTGDQTDLNGLTLNTSGRAALWKAVWDSAGESPILGKGPGSASDLVNTLFAIGHPHNDFLRIYHDLGIVGVFLFAAGWLVAIRRSLAWARKTDDPIHWTSFLGLCFLLFGMLTDNVLAYPFVMVPLGFVVGISVARSNPAGACLDEEPAERLSVTGRS
jgi:O-antigen ligase